MTSGIYQIRNLVNAKAYVGKSCNIRRRFARHRSLLRRNLHSNDHLQAAWNMYGELNFAFEVIELCEETLLNEREIYWIAFIKCRYNHTAGGDGGALDEASLLKMAASLRGKKHSKSHKKAISAGLKGKPRPQEVKDKISHSKTGEVKSSEHKRKISKTLKGRKLSLSTRAKMSETRKGRKQSTLVCPHCAKSGGTAMRRWHFDNCKVKNGN